MLSTKELKYGMRLTPQTPPINGEVYLSSHFRHRKGIDINCTCAAGSRGEKASHEGVRAAAEVRKTSEAGTIQNDYCRGAKAVPCRRGGDNGDPCRLS